MRARTDDETFDLTGNQNGCAEQYLLPISPKLPFASKIWLQLLGDRAQRSARVNGCRKLDGLEQAAGFLKIGSILLEIRPDLFEEKAFPALAHEGSHRARIRFGELAQWRGWPAGRARSAVLARIVVQGFEDLLLIKRFQPGFNDRCQAPRLIHQD